MRDSKDNRYTHQRKNRKSRFFSSGNTSESQSPENKNKGYHRPAPTDHFVPVHLRTCQYHPDTKLVSDYYPDIDLLIIKCPQRLCEYHSDSTELIENFRTNKAKKRRYWEEKNRTNPLPDPLGRVQGSIESVEQE